MRELRVIFDGLLARKRQPTHVINWMVQTFRALTVKQDK
jgi:hypothetical protein